jgi:hypothetical protein
MMQLPMRPPGNRLGESVIMKIADIRASVHEMAVPVPLLEKPSKRRFLFCTVETDVGRTGYAVSGGAHLAHAVPVALTHHFLPLLKGMDPRDTEAIHEAVWWTLNQRTLTGVVWISTAKPPAARSRNFSAVAAIMRPATSPSGFRNTIPNNSPRPRAYR